MRSAADFSDVHPEQQRRHVFGEARRAVGGDRHSSRKAGVLRRVENRFGRRRRRDVGEPYDGIDRVVCGGIWTAAQHGERVDAVRPGEMPVERAIGVDRADNVSAHVAELHAVADLVVRVDRVGEPLARMVEAEVGHVADVHHVAGCELVEDEIAALLARLAGGRCGLSDLHGDPGRRVAVECGAAHAVELLFHAGAEVDETELVLRESATAPAV